MKKNVGTADRLVRVSIGLILLSRVFASGKFRWLGLFGLVPLTTGLTGRCPAYTASGKSTAHQR